MGPGCVKNDKKGCFHTRHLTTIPFFPKNKVIGNHLRKVMEHTKKTKVWAN